MNLRRLASLSAIFLLTLVFTVILARPAWVQLDAPSQAIGNTPPLFTPATGTSPRTLSTNPTVVRQRVVTANTSVLPRTRGDSVTLNLFDDVSYQVVIERVDQPFAPTQQPSTRRGIGNIPTSGQGVTVQFGRVQSIPNSEVYLATKGDRLSASVRLPDGTLYEVSPTNAKTLVIREINAAAFPPDEPLGALKRMLRSTTRGTRSAAPQTAFDALPEPTALKVIVLYTPSVTKREGGEENMALFLSRLQEQTNQGYRQSDIKQLRVKITGWKEVDYTESGDAEKDIEALIQFATEKQLRKTFQADVVSLWVTKMNNGCGIGNLNQTAAEFQQHAFMVVKVDCAANNFSFAHELGHNLGSCHDRDTEPDCPGAFPYSFGYRDPEGDFRTIMAYECKKGNHCPRVNAWSSPGLVFNRKKTMGVAEKADNARSLNQVT
jgi:hypothetical protein